MYTACVVGAGSIGALKEDKYDSPTTNNILTHSHMYFNHPEIELIGIIDSNFEKAEQAGEKWYTNYCSTIDSQIWNSYGIDNDVDIISVCVPTEYHKEVLIKILKINPKIVIAEKPFCSNSKEAQEVIDAYEKANIPIIINYPRRYVPEIQQLQIDIRNEYYGKIQSATFHMTRGLIHDGCHGLDLCRYLFGEYIEGQLFKNSSIADRDENDPTYAAHLTFENCPHVFLSPCDGRLYKVFQLEIMTEKGKIVLSQHGMYIDFYPLIDEPIWGGFEILSKDLESRKQTQLNKSLEYLVADSVIKLYCITTNQFRSEEIICTAQDALKVHKIIENLKGETV
jgi:predicted dehydrogenase